MTAPEPPATTQRTATTIDDAQYRLLYAAVVANKSASFAQAVMKRFLARADRSPYEWIKRLDAHRGLRRALKRARSGSYTRLTRCFREIANSGIDLRTATPAELEQIHGIGPKTARFAIMWIRPQERWAALDVHVLGWLRHIGYPAPRSTPPGPAYRALEQQFIAEADRRGLAPRMLDAMIWEHASQKLDWPDYLQKEPAPVPSHVLSYFASYAA